MIKRYKYEEGVIGGDDSILYEREDGEYVKYEDVEELLNPWRKCSLDDNITEWPKRGKRVMFTNNKTGTSTILYFRGLCEPTVIFSDFTHWMYIPEVGNE